MAFRREEVSDLLVAVHRRCCICHRFCGAKIETDHIVPSAEGQDDPDDIDNAIAVCFECHAEIHSYNDQHPRGRKFMPEELRAHRVQWLAICKNSPEVLVAPFRTADVGPLQALIDELEFNLVICQDVRNYGALFMDEQFRRALQRGAISVLELNLKNAVLEAYKEMSRANQKLRAEMTQDAGSPDIGRVIDAAILAIKAAHPKVTKAHNLLLRFLSSEGDAPRASQVLGKHGKNS
jgi:hypothetical protein